MLDLEQLKRDAVAEVDRLADTLIEVADDIGHNPELGLQEYRSVGLLTGLLEAHGLGVERGIAGLETAFRCDIDPRHERPRVAILAEYDALPDIGHACGHNLIGTSAIGAGLALAKVMGELPGSVVVLGTPAEESAVDNAGGKVHMVNAGVFDDVDAAIMFHPAAHTAAPDDTSLAARGVEFAFHGKSAHAAAAPHEGINALDAVIQTFNSINALRQHVKSDVRIHGIITAGGRAPNVVPAYAACRFRVRSADAVYLEDVFRRVVSCAEGAASATGARLEWREYILPYDNILPNEVVRRLFKRNLEALGLEVLDRRPRPDYGSSDFGNVSQRVPGLEARIAIAPLGTPGHSDAFREAALSEQGHTALLQAAKSLAMTAIDLLGDREALTEARARLEEQKAAR